MQYKHAMNFFRIKSFSDVRADAQKTEFKKNLGALDLVLLGLGSIIGTGIFVLTGLAAAKYAGPSITVSFLLSAVACIFTALAYAELASMLPVSGGAYTYAYVTLGEGLAALVGWSILMVTVCGAATVAAGWSGYFMGVLTNLGFHFPDTFTKIPSDGGIINLPAFLIVMILSSFLVRGTSDTAKLNAFLVVVKLGAIAAFIVAAIPCVNSANWAVFAPKGFFGITAGASFIFMAYTGFDTLASSAEECKNPNRDLPIGIIGSLVGSAILYILVSGLLTAIVPYSTLNNAEPIAHALRMNGVDFGAKIVAIGAIAGMTTVILSQVYGFSRILFVMARDGMLPKTFARLNKRFATPQTGILVGGLLIALVAGLVPVSTLGELTSMTTLSIFTFVSLGVMFLRYKKPDEIRTFKCPAVYVVASISSLLCFFLFTQLLAENWKTYLVSLMIGTLVYVVYGYRNSSMNPQNAGTLPPQDSL
jgi:APA family basic amino acid/polyamine antiporter